ncbi:protein-glutamate O-methyltransferase CheR [Acetobacteraceae bacterium KSS8]|uniref:protein-glutamate O-methyltransferase n=1 Tax=Endosaccharibacter trunci TaxID=2812733 RepID=A0ABT1W6P7_9PROT|nr:protein-glutamate O-methyltransferase CheR [Acetobacteraceae bacterium KSS8]
MTGFEAIAAIVKARSGLALGPDKEYLVEARLGPIVRRRGLASLSALADRLRTDSALEQEVVEAMTTNETLFFRDGKPFDHLRDVVLPRLTATRPKGAKLRIWSAAASTGQEAYSMAILVCEMGAALTGRSVEIVGTDIARDALSRATEGLYSQFEVQRGLPARLLVKYFTKEDQGWRINRPLRDMVQFRSWNLLGDLAALGRFDVIFCRNVLIYFDQPTKARTLQAMSRLLADDGTLYLGGAETLLGIDCDLCSLPGAPGTFTRQSPNLAIKTGPAPAPFAARRATQVVP